MEVLFHFLFELIKISILALIYATITLGAFRAMAKVRPNSWIDRVSRNTGRFWILSGLIIGLVLFCYMFTYWGDHGLGDSARIPIGNLEIISQLDGSRASIKDANGHEAGIKKFIVKDATLYAQTESDFDTEGYDFLIWHLTSASWSLYKTEDDYLKSGEVPNPETFVDFDSAYRKYWSGWRFWLLP